MESMENTHLNKFVLDEKYDGVPACFNRDETKEVDVLPDHVDNDEKIVYNPRKECL